MQPQILIECVLLAIIEGRITTNIIKCSSVNNLQNHFSTTMNHQITEEIHCKVKNHTYLITVNLEI